jgi:hypothetical protein
MHEVGQSVILLGGKAQISAAPFRDTVSSRGDMGSKNEGPPPANRIVLLLIASLTFGNVTSAVLMLRSWADNLYLSNDVTETLLVGQSIKEEN